MGEREQAAGVLRKELGHRLADRAEAGDGDLERPRRMRNAFWRCGHLRFAALAHVWPSPLSKQKAPSIYQPRTGFTGAKPRRDSGGWQARDVINSYLQRISYCTGDAPNLLFRNDATVVDRADVPALPGDTRAEIAKEELRRARVAQRGAHLPFSVRGLRFSFLRLREAVTEKGHPQRCKPASESQRRSSPSLELYPAAPCGSQIRRTFRKFGHRLMQQRFQIERMGIHRQLAVARVRPVALRPIAI